MIQKETYVNWFFSEHIDTWPQYSGKLAKITKISK